MKMQQYYGSNPDGGYWQQPSQYQYAYPPPAPYPYDPQREEYRLLRRHGIGVSVCLLTYFIMQEIIVTLLVLTGMYDRFLNNASFQYSFSAVFLSFFSLAVPFFILSLKKGRLSYIGALPFDAPKNKKAALFLVFAGWAICLAGNFAAGVFGDFLNGIGVEIAENPVPDSTTALDVVLNIICTAAVPALVEEFVFRGVILQPLRRYGDHFAVISTAVIFGLAHGSPVNFVFAFIAGLAMGYAVVLSGSIWPGVIVHFLNNCFAVVVSEIYGAFPRMSQIPYIVAVSAIIVLGFGSVAALIVMKSFKQKNHFVGLSTGKRIRGFFLSVPMLLDALILFYYMSLSIS